MAPPPVNKNSPNRNYNIRNVEKSTARPRHNNPTVPKPKEKNKRSETNCPEMSGILPTTNHLSELPVHDGQSAVADWPGQPCRRDPQVRKEVRRRMYYLGAFVLVVTVVYRAIELSVLKGCREILGGKDRRRLHADSAYFFFLFLSFYITVSPHLNPNLAANITRSSSGHSRRLRAWQPRSYPNPSPPEITSNADRFN